MLRKTLFWAHLVAGVLAGAVILMMSATGTVLMYEKQVMEWRERSYFVDPAPHAERLDAEALVAAAATHGQEVYGDDFSPTSLLLSSDPRAAVQVRGGRDRLYLDPYTGELQGTGFPKTAAFLSTVRGWHRWFNLSGDHRSTGRAITGASNLLFLLILVTGAFIWIPRRLTLRHLAAVTVPRKGLRGRARDFNWHNALGVWSLVPMIIIVVSGAVISYRWAGNLVYRVAGEEPPVRRSRGAPVAEAPETDPPVLISLADVDAGITAAGLRVPDWRTLSVSLPHPGETSASVRIYRGFRGQPQKSSTLEVGPGGAETGFTTFGDASPGRRARSFLRFAHTGEFWGLPGQTVAGIVSLFGVILVWTGISLALRRLARAYRRRWNEEFRDADERQMTPEPSGVDTTNAPEAPGIAARVAGRPTPGRTRRRRGTASVGVTGD